MKLRPQMFTLDQRIVPVRHAIAERFHYYARSFLHTFTFLSVVFCM